MRKDVWNLLDSVGFSEYYGMFVEEGIENITDLKDLTKDDLKDIGVKSGSSILSVLIYNHSLEYGNCIIVMNTYSSRSGKIGYNVYSFHKHRWLFGRKMNNDIIKWDDHIANTMTARTLMFDKS